MCDVPSIAVFCSVIIIIIIKDESQNFKIVVSDVV